MTAQRERAKRAAPTEIPIVFLDSGPSASKASSMSHKAAAFFAILAMMGMMFVLPRDWGIATPLYSLLALGVGGIVWFALIDLKPGERSGPAGDEEPEQKLG